MKVKNESEVTQSCPTLSNPLGAYQAPPSMGFSRQEYWSGVPLPSPIFALEGRKGEWKTKINRHSKLTQGAIIPLLRVLRKEAIENGRAQ